MQPVILAILLGLIWAAIHFQILPKAQARWDGQDLKVKMARAGMVAVLEKFADFALIGACTLLVMMLLVEMLGLWAASGVQASQSFILLLGNVYDWLKDFAEGYGLALTWLGVIGGAVALWGVARQARRRVVDVWREKAVAEHAAILEDPALLEAMRNDEEWRSRVEQIDAAAARFYNGDGGAPGSVSHEALKQHLQGLLFALAIERASRSVDLPGAVEATPETSGPPSTGWRRVTKIVGSRKFSEDLGLVRKPLGRLVTALLFVSLIGWSSATLANSARLTVNNLRVNFADSDAQRRLDVALSQEIARARADPSQAAAQRINPGAATRSLARAITQEMVRTSPMHRVDVAGTDHDDMAALRDLLADRQVPAVDPSEGAAGEVRREVALDAGKPQADHLAALQARVEERIAPVVERLNQERPGVLRAAMAWADTRYSEAGASADARTRLTESMLDLAADRVDAAPTTALGKQAQKLTKEFGKETLLTWIDAQTRDLMANMIIRSSRPSVARGLELEIGNDGQDFLADLDNRRPDDWATPSAVAEERDINSKVADAAVGESGPGEDPAARRAAADMLGGYDSVFPAAPSADGSAIPPGSTAAERSVTSEASAVGDVAGRFGSFEFASRSFRARGVVVGRDLTGKLDISGIRWTIVPAPRAGVATKVALELRVRNGQSAGWRSVGRFDAGTVNQAIRYAGDGRVIATTIVAGDGKHVARLTNLHPALIDTPLGCRVVESDRWIDTFTVGPGVASATWRDRTATWNWLKHMELAETLVTKSEVCQDPRLGRVFTNFPAPAFSPGYGRALNGFLATRLNQPGGSGSFVQAASACAMKSGAAARDCLCRPNRASALQALPDRYWFPEDHTSQLRESPVSLTPDLKWLAPSTDHLGNFDFWVHTTFSLRQSGKGDESRTTAFDFPASALTELRQLVRTRLPGHLSGELHSSYDDFVRPLEEFVLVQRLARAALTSRLGRDFPTVRLLQLARETRKYVPRQPTVRWDPVGRPDDLYQFLKGADERAAQLYKTYNEDLMQRVARRQPLCAASSL